MTDKKYELKWIESAGGPYLVRPKGGSDPSWMGVASNDYADLCDRSPDSYAEAIDIDDKSLIVLGGEPLPLSVWRNGDDVVIFRWVHGFSDAYLLSFVHNRELYTLVESADVSLSSGSYIVFDSALPDDFDRKLFPSAEFQVYKPIRSIDTRVFEPDADHKFLIHFFED